MHTSHVLVFRASPMTNYDFKNEYILIIGEIYSKNPIETG